MNVSGAAFHDTMRNLAPFAQGDRLTVVNGRPCLYVVPSRMERCKEIFRQFISCSCLRRMRDKVNEEQRVKEAIIVLINTNADNAAVEDLPGLTVCKNYLRSLTDYSAEVSECVQAIERIRQRFVANPLRSPSPLNFMPQERIPASSSQIADAENLLLFSDQEIKEGRISQASADVLQFYRKANGEEFCKFIQTWIALAADDPARLDRLVKLFNEIGPDIDSLNLKMPDPAQAEGWKSFFAKIYPLPNLRALYLDDSFLLLVQPKFTSCTCIFLTCKLQERTKEAIQYLKSFVNLTALSLVLQSKADPAALREVSKLTQIETLRIFNLGSCDTARVPPLKPLEKLRSLELMGLLVGQEDALALQGAARLVNLTINRVLHRSALEQIAKMRSLTYLKVICKELTHDFFLGIVENLPELLTLCLEADVSAGPANLGGYFKNYPKLTSLALSNVKISSQADLDAVVRATALHKTLESLSIGVASKELDAALKAKLPSTLKVETSVKGSGEPRA